ncbi:glycosyltransferase family 4 protein [Puniceicoccales bacterium CK1056]|uniref:Glycosyltransferase family 4 protein n=1 Tax=Oceanipulchritudo coccoides TaxID=2706888 RepID=A0A6B2M409_9BACT|nr:glycosyltransferase family 1 protein [Oceanipulchritudo coccoides]NDV63032.1 glycosyltransferase family 4 protein [Oceanipulchritudo coccoides]
MHLFIDASNLRRGGGVTHLQEILQVADLKRHGFSKVTVWAPKRTLERIGDIPLVERRTHPLIDKGRIHGVIFRRHLLDRQIEPDVNLLWAPGGTYQGSFRPYVTMLRNFLPFDFPERARFKYRWAYVRLVYLKHVQTKSFKRATGLIHISQKAHDVLNEMTDLSKVRQTVIHHGLSERFLMLPRPQRQVEDFTEKTPARLLYISHINLYKHQDKLIQAVAKVRERGIPAEIHLVGPALPAAKRMFDPLAARLDPEKKWIKWHGEIPYFEVREHTQQADLYTCTSTCETFGMVLLEAMGSGLPVVCSDRSALPEIQGDTGLKVDPENVTELAHAIEKMLRDKALRMEYAMKAYDRAKTFTWERCAEETFEFLRACATQSAKH